MFDISRWMSLICVGSEILLLLAYLVGVFTKKFKIEILIPLLLLAVGLGLLFVPNLFLSSF
jgi:hypothetical protein